MGELLLQAASPTVLNAAWKRLSKDKAEWLPGFPRWDMERDLVYHLTKLAEDLRNGTFRPAPVRQFPVAKADGGHRVISALSLRDKLAQRAVLMVLEPLGEALFHHDSFGYRPGYTINMALAKARQYVFCGLPWLVDADIRSFFDQIPHGPLRKVLKKIVPDKDVLRLIHQWLETGTPRTGLLRARRGIPQGAVLSPFLCNLYLNEFDWRLSGKNQSFVRFADDFLIFTPDRRAAEAARNFAGQVLERMGLALHPRKTRIVKSGPHVRFLGQKLPKPRVIGPPQTPAR